MSENHKYYYLKLHERYFEKDNVKILESIEPNGHIYSLIILKLYLKSLKYDGRLQMTDRIPYDPNNLGTLAKVIGHDLDNLRLAIKYATDLELVTIVDSTEIYMTDIQEFIGLSSTEADRKRRYRLRLDKNNELPEHENGTNVQTNICQTSTRDKDRDKDRDKEKEIPEGIFFPEYMNTDELKDVVYMWIFKKCNRYIGSSIHWQDFINELDRLANNNYDYALAMANAARIGNWSKPFPLKDWKVNKGSQQTDGTLPDESF